MLLMHGAGQGAEGAAGHNSAVVKPTRLVSRCRDGCFSRLPLDARLGRVITLC